MPEGPEVETVRRGLLVGRGKKIDKIYISPHKKYSNKGLEELEGYILQDIERYGKQMVFTFNDNGALIYGIHHLGMTGYWRIFPSNSPIELAKHTKLVFYTSEFQLHFIDVRTFGHFYIVKSKKDVESIPYIKTLGPDILDPKFNVFEFRRRARGKNRSKEVGKILLESSVVSGCGNIYKSESLFRARINPFRPINEVTDEEFEELAKQLCAVGQEALASGGSTLKDFSNVDGYSGLMQNTFKVYGRAGEPCVICDTSIESAKQGGRSTFYCPSCQN